MPRIRGTEATYKLAFELESSGRPDLFDLIGKCAVKRRRNWLMLWSGLSESNRHLNFGKDQVVKSNALERRHLAAWKSLLIGN
jgi:hypothetical protein